MGHPYDYLIIWTEYQSLWDAMVFEWEQLGMMSEDLYFKFIEAERRWLEATGR